jgi:hypothetical protein
MIDPINWRGQRWANHIGNVEALWEDSRHFDLTLVEAVSKAMANQESSNKGISDGLEELSDVIAAVDSNLAKNCKLLNVKIQALERKVAATPVPAPALVALTMDTPIHDAHGDCVTTLGRLMQESDDIKNENSLLLQQLDRLAADITAQGRVMLGRHNIFTSEIHLLQLFMKECPKGDAFAAFVDPMVVFCFDQSYSPLTGWETLTKAMEKLGSYPVTDRKVVVSYNAHHCYWFLEHKMVVAGKTLAAFALKDKGQGVGGMDGRRAEIELSLESSADGVQTAIEDKLPKGSQLGQLALCMLKHTLNWFSVVFKHLDLEFMRLTQVHISEEETLILLSEEVIIMFYLFHVI